jgi:hypothetical protein
MEGSFGRFVRRMFSSGVPKPWGFLSPSRAWPLDLAYVGTGQSLRQVACALNQFNERSPREGGGREEIRPRYKTIRKRGFRIVTSAKDFLELFGISGWVARPEVLRRAWRSLVVPTPFGVPQGVPPGIATVTENLCCVTNRVRCRVGFSEYEERHFLPPFAKEAAE